jgi:hypothetical protein
LPLKDMKLNTLIALFFLLSFSSAQIVIESSESETNQEINLALPQTSGSTFNNNTGNVNHSVTSDIWLASECLNGECDNVVDTTGYLGTQFVNLSGDTMTGSLEIQGSINTTAGTMDFGTTGQKLNLRRTTAGAWMEFVSAGTSIGSLNNLFGLMAFQSLNNNAFCMGTDDIGQRICLFDTGGGARIEYVAQTIHQIIIGTNPILEIRPNRITALMQIDLSGNNLVNGSLINSTNLQIDETILGTNLSIGNTGGIHFLNVSGNLTYPTYREDFTSSFSYDTCYTNTREQEIEVYGSHLTQSPSASDTSYYEPKVNLTGCDFSGTGTDIGRIGEDKGVLDGNFPFSIRVPAGARWGINSTVTGLGAITVNKIWISDR